eukprot:COSAG02_NODE_8807_length_2437_cov_2.457656_2_plen_158_part_00
MFDNEFSWLNNKTIALATSVWPSGTALEGVILPPAPSFPAVDGGRSGDVAAQMAAAGGSRSDGEDAPGISLPPAVGEWRSKLSPTHAHVQAATAVLPPCAILALAASLQARSLGALRHVRYNRWNRTGAGARRQRSRGLQRLLLRRCCVYGSSSDRG